MSSRDRKSVCVGLGLAVIFAATAVAQPSNGGASAFAQVGTLDDATFKAVWDPIAAKFATELSNKTSPAEQKAVYKKMLQEFVRGVPTYDQALASLIREVPESALAQSTNAPLTNPVSNQLIERSGLTELMALAADFKKIVSADESAVSLNLNAVALFGLGKEGSRGAQYLYAQHEHWRRLGGTVTFGAKVPEKAITGLSSLPNAEELFDAISWDVKLRLAGDRDPRASRWYPLLIDKMGSRVELLTRLAGLPVPVAEVGPLKEAANEVLGEELKNAKQQIASSLQLSIKASGVHLTKVEGKNKYTFAAMLDKGFGNVDLTANASFNAADVPQEGATDPFKSTDLQLAAGLTGSILKGVVVKDRAVELALSFSSKVFVDDASVPIDRKNTFNVNTTLSIPFQLKAKIPACDHLAGAHYLAPVRSNKDG